MLLLVWQYKDKFRVICCRTRDIRFASRDYLGAPIFGSRSCFRVFAHSYLLSINIVIPTGLGTVYICTSAAPIGGLQPFFFTLRYSIYVYIAAFTTFVSAALLNISSIVGRKRLVDFAYSCNFFSRLEILPAI